MGSAIPPFRRSAIPRFPSGRGLSHHAYGLAASGYAEFLGRASSTAAVCVNVSAYGKMCPSIAAVWPKFKLNGVKFPQRRLLPPVECPPNMCCYVKPARLPPKRNASLVEHLPVSIQLEHFNDVPNCFTIV